ncbi:MULTISPECIES: CPBP family intramembrane glutamic endopeptidase [Bacillaceae]|uniref:CPBP family intramembrane glutamic endopeptidase n=1 Tax=Bacillaceae TaxID=186817 RepID=UPI002FFFAFA2
MKKEYWYILITYIVMQLSSGIGVPAFQYGFRSFGFDMRLAVPIWLIASFSLCLIIVLFLLRKEIKAFRLNDRDRSFGQLFVWSILGFFMAYFSQYISAIIEQMIGIKSGSENTRQIINIIDTFPLAVIVTSIIGPILEEIVFRKIVFGAFYTRFNFFISALISSVVFALAHMDFEHILIYAAMGFTFAFLYVKTKRIIVPIIAHVSMNTLVVLVQSVYRDDIERMMREAESVQHFIGGFL